MKVKKELMQESVGRRATRTFFASVVGKFLALLITILTFIFVARLLGPSNYGVYTVAIGYATLIGAVSIFGIAAYFDRHISYMSYRRDGRGIGRILSNGYAIIVPISIILAVIGIGLSGFIAHNFLTNSGIESVTLIIISLDLFFSTIWGASYSALIGFGKGMAASIDLVLLGLTQLVIGVALIYAGYGVNGAVIGLLVGDIVGFAATSYHTYRAAKSYEKSAFSIPGIKEIKKTLLFALPLATNNLMLVGTVGFGTLFLSMYATNFVLGNYGTALKGLGMMNVVYGTLAIVLIQSFSTLISQKKTGKQIADTYNETLKYSLLLNLPIVVFVGVFAKPIIYTFLGSTFSLAPLYLTVIAIGTGILIINSFTSSFFIAAGKVNELMKISLLSVISQIIGLIVLVPMFNAIGAVVALYITGMAFTLLLYARGLKRHFGIRIEYKKMLNVFVANLVMAMILSFVLNLQSNVLQIAVGVIALALLYPPLLVVFRAMDGKVLEQLDHLVTNIPIVGQSVKQFDIYTRFFINIFDKKE